MENAYSHLNYCLNEKQFDFIFTHTKVLDISWIKCVIWIDKKLKTLADWYSSFSDTPILSGNNKHDVYKKFEYILSRPVKIKEYVKLPPKRHLSFSNV